MPPQAKASALISSQLQEQLGLLLKTALRVTGDKGNVQLVDPTDCTLKIVVHSGFEEEFLNFFRGTQDGHAACGMGLMRRERVILEDVCTNPIFVGTEAQSVVLRAGVRAVQSTPMLDRTGRILGVLSTHYRKPTRPGAGELRVIDNSSGLRCKVARTRSCSTA